MVDCIFCHKIKEIIDNYDESNKDNISALAFNIALYINNYPYNIIYQLCDYHKSCSVLCYSDGCMRIITDKNHPYYNNKTLSIDNINYDCFRFIDRDLYYSDDDDIEELLDYARSHDIYPKSFGVDEWDFQSGKAICQFVYAMAFVIEVYVKYKHHGNNIKVAQHEIK